jgi:hypothetical protein
MDHDIEFLKKRLEKLEEEPKKGEVPSEVYLQNPHGEKHRFPRKELVDSKKFCPIMKVSY